MPQQPPLITWTAEELKEQSNYLAARIGELRKIKENKKTAMKDFSDTITEMEEEIEQLAALITEQTTAKQSEPVQFMRKQKE